MDEKQSSRPHPASSAAASDPYADRSVAPAPAPAPPPSASTRRPDRTGAQPITDRKLRRLYGWETWVVLSIFPLASTIAAVTYLLMHVTTGVEYSSGSMVIAGEPGLSLTLSIAIVISEFAAAGLVVYLLIRNGEGLQSIGLAGHRFRKDLALLLPVWIFVQVIPQAVGSALLASLHIPRYSVLAPALPVAFVAVALLKSLQAGVVEEIVVLGYLVRRLEQRGWTATAVVVVAVLVRVSYHLYYGPGVLPILLWAIATVLMYRRIRRLMPFIVCHFVWDASIAINACSRTAAVLFNGLFFVSAVVFTLLWSRDDSTPPMVVDDQGPRIQGHVA
jgi:membrane protease YdiL (CAAX protease family)